MTYPVLQLNKGRERSLYHRHPWIFSGAVKTHPPVDAGAIVQVKAHDGAILGYGFYHPQSQITCKVFSFRTEAVESFDDAYWLRKLQQAMAMRQRCLDGSRTNAYRWVHAEGDTFPGLIADVYGDTVVAQVLHQGTALLAEQLPHWFRHFGFKNVYFKSKNASEKIEGVSIPDGWQGEAPQLPLVVKEHGLLFQVNPETGQKTGFFLDQRDNRQLLGQYAKGKRVLNTFSYTGGFSVYALHHGAEEVVSVDISKDAVAQCEQQIMLNNLPKEKHQAVAADCFDYLKQEGEGFDVMVLDPPAFAKNKRSVMQATRGYKELNLSAIKRIKPGGIIFTFSCSKNIDRDLFRKIVFGAAADARRDVRIIHQLTQGADHPVNIYHPEGEYLKGLVLYVS